MEKLLNNIIEKNRWLVKSGKVASYIPALSLADPNDIAIVTMDMEGIIHTGGNFDTKFTIQSISKVLALMVAVMELGEENVFKKVGYNGSSESFNNISNLDFPNTAYPTNPMINAGAIVVTSLIKGSKEEKFNKILELIQQITDNNKIYYNTQVYLSEKETGDRNRAIAYLLKNKNMIQGDVDHILDAYFKQCSIEIDSVDLAKIGRFIANGCKDLTNTGYINSENMTKLLLSIMSNCGMYDYSGEYAARVGIPSKSGVAGGLMSAVPRKLGIGVYNPVLDLNGNPIVGVGIMEDLSKELGLNLFN